MGNVVKDVRQINRQYLRAHALQIPNFAQHAGKYLRYSRKHIAVSCGYFIVIQLYPKAIWGGGGEKASFKLLIRF